MQRMYIAIEMRGANGSNATESVLKTILRSAYELVETSADAEVILTDSPTKALECLKENEMAKVVIGILPWDRNAGPAAQSLKKAYADRVIVRPFVEKDGEENFVLSLMRGEVE